MFCVALYCVGFVRLELKIQEHEKRLYSVEHEVDLSISETEDKDTKPSNTGKNVGNVTVFTVINAVEVLVRVFKKASFTGWSSQLFRSGLHHFAVLVSSLS